MKQGKIYKSAQQFVHAAEVIPTIIESSLSILEEVAGQVKDEISKGGKLLRGSNHDY